MKKKCDFDQAQIFARFEDQELPFDMTLASKSAYCRALKMSLFEKTKDKEDKRQNKCKTPKNGFMVSEALLALLICSISGFLVLASSSALAKTMQMDVQSEMDIDMDLEIEQYDQEK
ncbi:MAG: hypothetical protein Q4A59_02935 [Erysipelotrichaceae bacterium]|nr:hypothetical protein [Erysipelotrichaceae bacterium]